MRLLLILALSVLTACQSLTPPPLGGRIRDLHNGQAVTPQTLVERLAKAPRVVVGEQHDNPDHHALQLWLLQALAGQRAQGSLLLEMLTPSQQPRVDSVRQLPALPKDLPGALAWSPAGIGVCMGLSSSLPWRNAIRCWPPTWTPPRFSVSIGKRPA